jgi:hypothetical protein
MEEHAGYGQQRQQQQQHIQLCHQPKGAAAPQSLLTAGWLQL